MALFKILKGKSANLPSNKVNGYCYVTTDEHKLYVDYTKDDGTLDRFALNAVYADTAGALTTSAGSATQPIYFSNGKPVATTYTLSASVPSGAKFTDTTYSAGTGLTLSGTNFSVTSSDASEIMNQLSEGTSLAQQDDYLIAQYANGGSTTKTYHRKKVKNIITGANVKAALGIGTETTKFLRNDGTWQVPTDSKGNDIASTYLTVDKEVPQIKSQQVYGYTQRTRDQNIIVAVAKTEPLTLSISVDGGFTYNDYATSLIVSKSDTARYYTVHRIETSDTPKAEIVFYNLAVNSAYRIVRFKYSSANNSLVLMNNIPDTFFYAFKFCYCPETEMAIKYNIAAEWNEDRTKATSTKEIHVYNLNGRGVEIYSTTKTTTSLVDSSSCDIGYNVVDGATSQKTYFYIFHDDMSINGTANVQHIERILITDDFSGSTTVSNSLITSGTVATNTVNEVCQVGGAFLFLGLLAAEDVTDYYTTARKNTIYSFVNGTYAAITLPAYLSPYSIRLRKFGDYAMVSGYDEQRRCRAFIYGYTYTATKVTEEGGSSYIYNPTAFKFLYEIPVHSHSSISTSGEFCPNSGLITYKGGFYDVRDGFNTKYTALYKVKLNGVKIFEYPGQ